MKITVMDLGKHMCLPAPAPYEIGRQNLSNQMESDMIALGILLLFPVGRHLLGHMDIGMVIMMDQYMCLRERVPSGSCTTRSRTVGMPNGLSFPFAFGM